MMFFVVDHKKVSRCWFQPKQQCNDENKQNSLWNTFDFFAVCFFG